MIIHDDGENKFSARNPVVTVGVFDGVHRGHVHILEHTCNSAGHLKGESVVVTLWPHPGIVLNGKKQAPGLLNTLEEKEKLLEKHGIDQLLVLPFTRHFSKLTGYDFVEKILVERLATRHLVLGYNHRFGKDRKGDYAFLKDCSSRFGFSIEQVPPVVVGKEKPSSSLIRRKLMGGEVERANHLLGYPYFLGGRIITGNRIGRKIGFPTANIQPDQPFKLVPGDGVYAVYATVGNERFPGMLNIGSRPTVNRDPREKTIEVHMIGFAENIYRCPVEIAFFSRIRDEMKFSGTSQLEKQLRQDKIDVLKALRSIG